MNTSGLDTRTAASLRAIAAELAVIHVDRPNNLQQIVPAIGNLVELESAGVYSVRNRTGVWELERWDACGVFALARGRMEQVCTNASKLPFYYNPMSPPAGQRNRVIDAYTWINATHPGSWEKNQLCTDVLRPLRAEHWHQPRALLCKGPALLGWFGGLDPAPPTARQFRLLRCLAAPMRDRLAAMRALSLPPYVRGALDVLLRRIGAPAFVLNATGLVEEANEAGRVLIREGQRDLLEKLRRATTNTNDDEFALIPVKDGPAHLVIAILRAQSREKRIAHCVELCAGIWGLTSRQAEVLGLVARGLSNTSIATLFGCVERTVEHHVSTLLERAGVDSRAALVSSVLTVDY